jgi:hypothetical protein
VALPLFDAEHASESIDQTGRLRIDLRIRDKSRRMEHPGGIHEYRGRIVPFHRVLADDRGSQRIAKGVEDPVHERCDEQQRGHCHAACGNGQPQGFPAGTYTHTAGEKPHSEKDAPGHQSDGLR